MNELEFFYWVTYEEFVTENKEKLEEMFIKQKSYTSIDSMSKDYYSLLTEWLDNPRLGGRYNRETHPQNMF